jgi:O-antigen biosynthesis protein WbqV
MAEFRQFIFPSFLFRLAVLAVDTAAAAFAFYFAVWFAFGLRLQWVTIADTSFYVWATLTFSIIASMVFVINGQHRGIWRYTSLKDLMVILRSSSASVLMFLPFVFLMTRATELPRSSIVLSWVFLTALLVGPRLIARLVLEGSGPKLDLGIDQAARIPALVIGVGTRAESFLREMLRDPNAVYSIAGLIAPNANWTRRELHGIPVFGTFEDLDRVLNALGEQGIHIQRLVLADETLGQDVIEKILEVTAEHGLTLGRLPQVNELIAGADSQHDANVRPVALEDLLQRPQKVLDRSLMQSFIAGRRVMVTGAGGSIGSELVRQVASFQPSKILLLDNSEFNLYAIDHEMGQSFPDAPRRTILCDVRDTAALNRWFDLEKPQVVFHAAALKHVPMIEMHPLEGILTNVSGTRIVADASLRSGAVAMVMVSTDKAVNPRNAMGATKRLAEAYCQALDLQGAKSAQSATRFVTVRFGNVLGSTGSVVPLFQKQLLAGGPLTVTHRDITRYFMTIREAVSLILQASGMGLAQRDDRGKIFVLDMGEPIKIADLARQMIRLAGKRPDIDVKITFIGLRPGEKLFEELLHKREELVESSQKGLLLATPRTADLQILKRDIDILTGHALRGDGQAGLALLKHCVPEFQQDDPNLSDIIREDAPRSAS